MIQIDLFSIRNFLKKYYAHIVAIILILYIFNGCNNTEPLVAEAKSLKKENVLLKKVIKNTLKENEQKDKEIIEHKKAILFLDNQNQKRQQEIFDLAQKNRDLKSSVNKYTTDELVKFYIERYKKPKEITKTNYGIAFKDTLSKVIANDLINYDFTFKELSISKEIIEDQNKISIIKDTVINNLEYQKKNLNFVVQEQGLLIDNQEDLISKQEKIIKKETRKKNILKLSIPAGIIVGIVTGVLITK